MHRALTLVDPKGVVLVIAPWNFPFNLALLPMMQAIAAGNCVLIKPSELASASADALKQFCEKHMDKCAVRLAGRARTFGLVSGYRSL